MLRKMEPRHVVENDGSGKPEQLIQDREQTHGNFKANADFCQALKFLFRNQKTYLQLNMEQREAIDMICLKLSRIITGKANYADHWKDLAGYATLGEKSCDNS